MEKNEVINKIKEYGFTQPLDYPGEAVVLHKIEGDYPLYVGYVLDKYVRPCTWDNEGSCYMGSDVYFDEYDLLVEKPIIKWYTDSTKFPALVKHIDNNEYFIVSKFNGVDRLRVKDSMRYVHKDRVEYIQTINSNYLSLLKLEREIDENKTIELHNLKSDLSDLYNMVNAYRCPCCSHYVSRGLVCFNCGYSNGADYTKEELQEMASKSKKIPVKG